MISIPKAGVNWYDSPMNQHNEPAPQPTQPHPMPRSQVKHGRRRGLLWLLVFIVPMAVLFTIWAQPTISAALSAASKPGLTVRQRLGAIKRTSLVYGKDAFFRLLTPLYIADGQEQIEASIAGLKKRKDLSSATNGPLKVHPTNGRYFADASGKIVFLTGSHTWLNLQDSGKGFPPPAFNYTQYLDFLQANNHNFFRLWVWEQTRWTVETADDAYWFNPHGPFQRTGPGTALDGKAKFDLSKFDQSYFDRVRERVIAARDRGIYVSVMLFNGWSVNKEKSTLTLNNPWKGHPFNAANNINGIDGDTNDDNSGEETHELGNSAVTAFQEAYVKKIIDTVNDLDNVLYEISNESHPASMDWQEHMVNVVHEYEATKAAQHPVGISKPSPAGDTPRLLSGPADWISPDGSPTDPFVSEGKKVIIYDTDHLCGMCYGETKSEDDLSFGHNFVWKSLLYGYNPVYMDGYDGAGYGVGGIDYKFSEARWVTIRKNMGYALDYSRRMNFAAMVARPDFSDTAWVLANASAANAAEYLVYQPGGGTFSVNLRETSGQLFVEWLNPATGDKTEGASVSGGSNQSFTPPFSGDAVLYLAQQRSVATATPAAATPTATATITATQTPIPGATQSPTPKATMTATPKPGITATSTPSSTRPAGSAALFLPLINR